MPFHLLPTFHPRPPNALRQPLREPLQLNFIKRQATDHEQGPGDGDRGAAGADADGAVGFARLDDVHEPRSEVADGGAERDGRVEGGFDVGESGETADFDLVIEVAHLERWFSVGDRKEPMDGIGACFAEEGEFGSGLEVGAVVERLGEVSHELEGRGDLAAKVGRETEFGDDGVVVRHTASEKETVRC